MYGNVHHDSKNIQAEVVTKQLEVEAEAALGREPNKQVPNSGCFARKLLFFVPLRNVSGSKYPKQHLISFHFENRSCFGARAKQAGTKQWLFNPERTYSHYV